jgi:hypothetical protein
MTMIVRCRHCERFYWRYRPDHPPRFYCSVICHDVRGLPKPAARPSTPQAILGEIRLHRRLIHDTDSILVAFDDCETCEELEGLYNQSLGFYMDHPELPASPDRTVAVIQKQRKRQKQVDLIARGAGE